MLHLTSKANDLVSLSVAPSTCMTYQSGIKAYVKLAATLGFNLVRPANEDVIRFVTVQSRFVSAATWKVYLAAVRYYLLSKGAPTEGLRSPRLTTVMKGIERRQFEAQQLSAPASSSKPRRAVNTNDLLTLKERLEASATTTEDKAVIWAAIMVACNGLLRVSEYASPSTSGTQRVSTLKIGQVINSKATVTVKLGPMKTAQFGGGGTVTLHPNSNRGLCPVSAIRDYMDKRIWAEPRSSSTIAADP